MIRQLFLTIDTLSYQPKFYTLGKERYKTIWGGILQTLLLIVNFIGIIYFAKDIYQRSNPNVIQYSGKEIFKKPFLFTKGFSVYITVMDALKGIPFRNESIYTVNFYQNILDIKNGFITSPLEKEVCSKDSFEEPIPQDILDAWNWDTYYCIKKGQNATLKGSDMDLQNWFLTAFVVPCDRTQKGHKCGTEKEIANLLTGTNVQSFFIDKYFDASDYKDPVKYYNKMQVYGASLGYKNLAWSHFKLVNLIDDTGVLFPEEEIKSVIAWDQTSVNFGPAVPGDPSIFQMIYQQSTAVENISRRYKRLQEVVASVGGLVGFLFVLSRLCIAFFTENMFYDAIFERYFKYDSKSGKFKRGSTKRRKTNDKPAESTAKAITYDEENSNGKKSFATPSRPSRNKSNSPNKNFLKGGNPITSSASESKIKNIKINCSSKPTISVNDRKSTGNFVKSLMDYDYLFNKFKEVEALKLVLFSPEQCVQFQNMMGSKVSSELLLRQINLAAKSGFEENSLEIRGVGNKIDLLEENLGC
jgi:hypothetical protein